MLLFIRLWFTLIMLLLMELLLLLRLNCCSLDLGVAVDEVALKVDDDATLGVTMLVDTEDRLFCWRDVDGGTFEYKLVLED